MALEIRDLYEKRNRIFKQAQDLHKAATDAGRDLTAEERQQWDKLMNEVGEIKATIQREERMIQVAAEISGEPRAAGHLGAQPIGDQKEIEQRKLVNFRNFLAGRPYEARDLQADTDIKGGFWVPQLMQAMIRQELDNLVEFRNHADIWPTPVAVSQSMGIPTLAADVEDLDWTGEIASVDADTAMQAGKRNLSSHLLSKLVKVAMALLDARPDAESLVAQRLGYKHSTVLENAYFNGSGASQALGVFTASANGISTSRDVSTDNTSSAPTFDGLVNAKYSVKAQYRKNGRWYGHRDFVKVVSKIKDGNDLPIFKLAESTGQSDMLLGYPLHESEYCPNTFTSGLYVAVFGDFKFYQIVDAKFSIQRLVEKYADTNQIGFIGRGGGDGMPIFENAFARVKLG